MRFWDKVKAAAAAFKAAGEEDSALKYAEELDRRVKAGESFHKAFEELGPRIYEAEDRERPGTATTEDKIGFGTFRDSDECPADKIREGLDELGLGDRYNLINDLLVTPDHALPAVHNMLANIKDMVPGTDVVLEMTRYQLGQGRTTPPLIITHLDAERLEAKKKLFKTPTKADVDALVKVAEMNNEAAMKQEHFVTDDGDLVQAVRIKYHGATPETAADGTENK